MSDTQTSLQAKERILKQMRATTEDLKRLDSSTFQLLQDHCVNAFLFRAAFVRGEITRKPIIGSTASLLDKWDNGGTLMLAMCVAQGRRLTPDETDSLVDDYETVISGSQFHVDICGLPE
jgi:hypothetical protein